MSKSNTIAGWVLAGGIAALGLSIASSMYFKSEPPEKPGYPVVGAETAAGPVADIPIATLLPTADPAKGADVFKKCGACHTINQGGANGVGPNLYATVGEAIGQGKGGFAFSDALKGVGGNWDFDKLNAWLTNPRKFVSGTKMTFAGLPDAKDRANVIVYLNSQGSNLPLPAAPAAAAAAPAAGNAAEGNSAIAAGNSAVAAAPANASAPAAKK